MQTLKFTKEVCRIFIGWFVVYSIRKEYFRTLRSHSHQAVPWPLLLMWSQILILYASLLRESWGDVRLNHSLIIGFVSKESSYNCISLAGSIILSKRIVKSLSWTGLDGRTAIRTPHQQVDTDVLASGVIAALHHQHQQNLRYQVRVAFNCYTMSLERTMPMERMISWNSQLPKGWGMLVNVIR